MDLSRKEKRMVFWLSAAVMADCLAAVLWTMIVGEWAAGRELPARLDGVVVLMADFSRDSSGLGPESRRRLNYAYALSRERRARLILCVGGSRPMDNAFGAKLMKRYLEKLGASTDRVFADARSYNTQGNLEDAARFAKQHGLKAIGMVSSPLHLFRTWKTLGVPGDSGIFHPAPYSAGTTLPIKSLWESWCMVHYEWATYGLYALPDFAYAWVLSFLRPQLPRR